MNRFYGLDSKESEDVRIRITRKCLYALICNEVLADKGTQVTPQSAVEVFKGMLSETEAAIGVTAAMAKFAAKSSSGMKNICKRTLVEVCGLPSDEVDEHKIRESAMMTALVDWARQQAA